MANDPHPDQQAKSPQSNLPDTLYRLRSVKNLIGKYQELERQEIYFAEPDELNDPLEGPTFFFWRGDKIAWRNLFHNYIVVLVALYKAILLTNANNTIINPMIMNYLCTEEFDHEKELLESNCTVETFPNAERVYKHINKLACCLDNNRHKIYKEELLFFLQEINAIIFPMIQFENIIRESIQDSSVREKVDSIIDTRFVSILNSGHLQDEMRKIIFDIIRFLEDKNLKTKKWTEENVIRDVPRIFVEVLEDLALPPVYTSCFLNNYRNSSLWGHYADGHKGACLIFSANTDSTKSSSSIFLKHRDNSSGPIPFHQVEYREQMPTIDFFKFLTGRLPDLLRKRWFIDNKSNKNSTHLSEYNANEFREECWPQSFKSVTTKTKDWAYEEEYRLMLQSPSGPSISVSKMDRTLTYDFNSLTGIIFGIKMSNSDKRKIIDIVVRKCRENKKSSFEFFQAYFDHNRSYIDKQIMKINVADL